MNKIQLEFGTLLFSLTLVSGAVVADSELPSAQSLQEAHIEAMGGIESIERQLESTTTGRFVMPAAGMEGNFVLYSRLPLERSMNIELPGIGSIESGYSDRQAWSVDPFMGPRILSGPELDMQIEANEIGAQLRSDEFVESMTTTEIAEFGGESCYQVEVKWKSGRESMDCYSVENGYMIASTATVESPMGVMETTTVFSDYKNFENDGVEVMMPAKTTVTTMGQEQQLIIDSVELGAPADENFETPPAIVTLMQDQSAE